MIPLLWQELPTSQRSLFYSTSIRKNFFMLMPILSSCSSWLWPALRGFTEETLMGCKREPLPSGEAVLSSLKFLSWRITCVCACRPLLDLSTAPVGRGPPWSRTASHIRAQLSKCGLTTSHSRAFSFSFPVSPLGSRHSAALEPVDLPLPFALLYAESLWG